MDRETVQSAITVAPGFAEALARGRSTQIQMLVEGTNSNTASILVNYASEIVRTYSSGRMLHLVTMKRMARGGQMNSQSWQAKQRSRP